MRWLLTNFKVREYAEAIALKIVLECHKAPVLAREKVKSLVENSKGNDTFCESESNDIINIKGGEDLRTWDGARILSVEELELVKTAMTKGNAFHEFCDNLRIWVFPRMREYIGSVIETSLTSKSGELYVVNCKANWEVSRYLQEELSGTHSFREVLTVTGSPDAAQAASATEYVNTIWGEKGMQLLGLFERSFSREPSGKSSFSNCPLNESISV